MKIIADNHQLQSVLSQGISKWEEKLKEKAFNEKTIRLTWRGRDVKRLERHLGRGVYALCNDDREENNFYQIELGRKSRKCKKITFGRVILHELGHILGLEHSNYWRCKSIMVGGRNQRNWSQDITKNDIKMYLIENKKL